MKFILCQTLISGFLQSTESDSLVAPIAVLYYETYNNEQELLHRIESLVEKFDASLAVKAFTWQVCPVEKHRSWNYADAVDVMRSLEGLIEEK